MDYFRRSIESRLFDLSSRLTASPSRWEDVNHLLLEVSKKQNINEKSFLVNFNIDRSSIKEDGRLVFVLMPFNPEFDSVYTSIKDACSRSGLSCERGDETHKSGGILKYILERMLAARVVIAVLDGRNPNVYYELGLAHALGKKVVMVAKDVGDLSFDVSSSRAFFYKSTDDIEALLPKVLLPEFIEE